MNENKKNHSSYACGGTVRFSFSGFSADKSEELVLYTWEGMFPPEVLEGFEEETGIKIVYSNFDTDETMLEKLSMAEGGDYDVVIADDYILEKVIAQGLAEKLDKRKLTNIENVNPCTRDRYTIQMTSIRFPTAQESR